MRGRVRPIGGLKEKVLAAHRGGIRHVLIPAENAKDVPEIPQAIRQEVTIQVVEHMDQVLREALVLDDPEGLFAGVARHQRPDRQLQAPSLTSG